MLIWVKSGNIFWMIWTFSFSTVDTDDDNDGIPDDGMFVLFSFALFTSI